MKSLIIKLLSFPIFMTSWIMLFSQSQELPEPFGGYSALRMLFQQEMYFPAEMRGKVKEAEVIVRFMADETGKPREVNFQTTAGDSFRQEAERLFRMIAWQPSRHDGKHHSGSHFIKITFSEKKYKRFIKKRGYDQPPFSFEPIDTSMKVFEAKALLVTPLLHFPDGSTSLREYLMNQLQYPTEAAKRDIQGIVQARLIVEPSGRPSNLHITHSVGAGCDEEAMRLIGQLNWTPGKADGLYVRSWVEISIAFTLSNQGGYKYHPTNHGGNIY